MRWSAVGLLFLTVACTTTTSHTRTGTGIFAPKPDDTDDDAEVPRGLTLSVDSIAPNGAVILTLRNYSDEPFTFAGTRDEPDLVLEARSRATRSHHTLSHWRGSEVNEVAAGDRMQLKTTIAGATGEIRIGVRSHEFGFVVWTEWFQVPR